MPKQYFGTAHTVTGDGQIRNESDIMLIEFTHVNFHNEEEFMVVALDKHTAKRLREILQDRLVCEENN